MKTRSLVAMIAGIASLVLGADLALAERAPWGQFQVLEHPQVRLTFLVQSAYLERIEKDIDQAPKISRFLMGKMSLDANERKRAIQEYREWWQARELEHISRLADLPSNVQLSTRKLSEAFEKEIQSEPPSSARRKRMLFVQMILKSGFHDFTLGGFRAIERLEAEKDLGTRLVGLAEALEVMTRDEESLETLASLSNLLLVISSHNEVSEANRKQLKPYAVSLSKKVDKAIREAGLIDVLNPANLVGGAVLFKTAGQVALRSPIVIKALSQWSKLSGVSKATVVSAAGHAAVLSTVIQPKTKAIDGLSNEATARLGQGISKSSKYVLQSYAGPANDSISLDSARSRAEELLYSSSSLKSAWKYAELIAYGERLLASEEIFNLSFRGHKTSDFIQRRDEVMLRFDRYMAKRGLKTADPEALAMLKAYVDEHIPKHQDGQPFVLLSTLRPALKGNCVSRTLALTAMFYPAYLRYENPDLKFGLMLWENHIEAVLFNTKSNSAMSIYSMTPLDLKSNPSVLSPRILAAAFLYRSVSPRLFGFNTYRSSDPYPRSRLVIAKSSSKQVSGPSDLTNSDTDRDPNPSPFISALYADQLSISDLKPQLDSRTSTGPASGGLRDVRDMMSALISSKSIDELSAKSNQTLGFRIQARPNSSNVADPFSTVLSSGEFGRLIPSRSPSKLSVGLVRGDEWRFLENSKTYLTRRSTPYKSAADVEAVLRKEFKDLQSRPLWQKIASSETNDEVRSLSDFLTDVDFQFELLDINEIVPRLKFINKSKAEQDIREFPFRYGVEDLTEVLGLADEFAVIQKTAAKLVAPLAADRTGRALAEFLEKANALKHSDRVRYIQGLYATLKLTENVELLDPVFARLQIQVVKNRKSDNKAKLPTEVDKAQTSFDWSKSKPLLVQVLPAKIVRNKDSSAQQEPRIKLALEAETVFLLLHYFHTALPDWEGLVGQMAESDEGSKSVLSFSSKFFGWMPAIDVHGSWQNKMADRWVDLSDAVCNPHPPVGYGWECVELQSMPTKTICDQKHSKLDRNAVPVKAPARSKSCDILSKISSELIFDEIMENYSRPGL